jgi:hypothetical protein
LAVVLIVLSELQTTSTSTAYYTAGSFNNANQSSDWMGMVTGTYYYNLTVEDANSKLSSVLEITPRLNITLVNLNETFTIVNNNTVSLYYKGAPLAVGLVLNHSNGAVLGPANYSLVAVNGTVRFIMAGLDAVTWNGSSVDVLYNKTLVKNEANLVGHNVCTSCADSDLYSVNDTGYGTSSGLKLNRADVTGTNWVVTWVTSTRTYTDGTSLASNATGSIINKLATVPTWVGIIIVVGLAFLVMGYFYTRQEF